MLLVAYEDVDGVVRVRATHDDGLKERIRLHPDYAGCPIFQWQGHLEAGEAVPEDAILLNFAEDLAAYAFEACRVCEQSGTTWNGWPVSTDDLAQARLQAEIIADLLGARVDGTVFIFEDQPRPLPNADLREVGKQVREHVLGCITRREQAKAGIAAGVVTTRAQVDDILAGRA